WSSSGCAAAVARPAVPDAYRPTTHRLLLDLRQHVLLGEDDELVVVDLHFLPRVFREEDAVADLDVHRDAVAVVVEAPRADGDHLALLWLLLRRVRDHDAGSEHLFLHRWPDDDAVVQGHETAGRPAAVLGGRLGRSGSSFRHGLKPPC